MVLNPKHPVAKDAKHRKKVLNELISSASDQSEHIVKSLLWNSDSINLYDSLSDLNKKNGMNIPLKNYGRMIKSLKFKADFGNRTTLDFINWLSISFLVVLAETTYSSEDMSLYIVRGENGGILFDGPPQCKYPNTNCMHYRDGLDIVEMVDNYNPSKVIFYLHSQITFSDSSFIMAIYLLDENDNFLTKLIVEIFDQSIAPTGCKKLWVPKSVHDFKNMM